MPDLTHSLYRAARLGWLAPFLVTVSAFAAPPPDTAVVDLRELPPLQSILPQLAKPRVVFVGETHDRYSHHLTQLAIIRALHQRHPDLAIGVEFFQQPFQQHLDAYVAGEIDEPALLRRTEYYDRWRFDYRLYRPIFRYAREQRIPLVALNVPSELLGKVAEVGVAGLSVEERGGLPEIDRSNERYRERLRGVHEAHSHRPDGSFEHFLDSQLLWDEGMAQRAADYLREHPKRPMVVLAGSGHLAYGLGIPQRLTRRLDVETAIVLNEPGEPLTADLADFILLPEPQPLPAKGRLGVFMEGADEGVNIMRFAEQSAAEAAGLRVGDRIVEINSQPVATPADVQIALLDREAGQQVEVAVRRLSDEDDELLRFTLTLR